MIFTRKYVFESKRTRLWRYTMNSLVVLFLALFSYGTFLAYLPFYADLERRTAEGALFQKSPDAIVVFTGDKGRIKHTFKLHEKWPEAIVLISGVYGSNSLKTLLPSDFSSFDTSQIELDYEAKNTLDNVRESLNYLKNSQTKINRVLIVSSDYHIYRIKMIFDHFYQEKEIKFYFDSVKTDWVNYHEWKKLLKESFKIIRVWFILHLME